jgi:hypothetical protein
MQTRWQDSPDTSPPAHAPSYAMAAHILAEGEEAEVVVRAEKIAARLEGLAESVQEFKTCEVRP